MLSVWFIAMRSPNWIFIIASESLFEVKNKNPHKHSVRFSKSNLQTQVDENKKSRMKRNEEKKKIGHNLYTSLSSSSMFHRFEIQVKWFQQPNNNRRDEWERESRPILAKQSKQLTDGQSLFSIRVFFFFFLIFLPFLRNTRAYFSVLFYNWPINQIKCNLFNFLFISRVCDWCTAQLTKAALYDWHEIGTWI